MLIGNYCVLNKSVGRRFGGDSTSLASGIGSGSICGLPSNFGTTGALRNFAWPDMSTNVLEIMSIPSGYGNKGWLMPITAGGMSSHNEIESTFTFTASGNYGRNIDSSITFDITIGTAQLGLIVGGQVSIPFSVVISQAALGGTQNMAASLVGPTFVVNPSISAESGLAATCAFSFTANGSTLKAVGSLSAEISSQGSAVTPQSVAAEVWNSVAAVFNTAGTMGNKMNSAASAGDPWTTSLPGAYGAGSAGQIIGTLQNDINLHTDSAIATLNLAELKFAIESLRPHHTGYGTAYFWNPVSGSDAADGLTPATACATFAHIHNNLAADYGHDIIYCLPESAGTGITTAEGIVISKNYLFLRGPGRDFEIDTSISGGAGVQITAKGVELHGVRVKTDPLSSADAIIISGDFAYIDDVWVEECGGDAIAISGSRNTIINECNITGYKGNAINLGNGVYSLWLNTVVMNGDGVGTNGVYINGATTADIRIMGRCEIAGNSGYAINIAAGGMHTMVSTDAHVDNNVSGDFNDPNGYIDFDGRIYAENATAPAIIAAATLTPIPANVKQLNDATLIGTGVDGDKWRG